MSAWRWGCGARKGVRSGVPQGNVPHGEKAAAEEAKQSGRGNSERNLLVKLDQRFSV